MAFLALAVTVAACAQARLPWWTSPPGCGDGFAGVGEECDDGGRRNGDGCSAACVLENTSALCAGVPAIRGSKLKKELIGLFASPVDLTAPLLDPRRVFVVEQAGRIRVVKDGAVLAEPFLDIADRVRSGGERGLLGLAFHPDYEGNGRFFLNYTDKAGDTVIARYEVGADADVAAPASEVILLTIDQPRRNHNGGQIAFGPDGYLYVGMGDGGGAGNPFETAQDDGSLLGKMLRIDVDVDAPPHHAVPPDNPNAAAGLPLGLVWSKGWRNPWRFAFDRATGDLYVADVGERAIEEIDFELAGSRGGANYGWDVFEGTACFEPDPDPACPEPPAGFVFPIYEYAHPVGCSVTGGIVYRGCAMPDMVGRYFFSDFCIPFVNSFVVEQGVATAFADKTAELGEGLTLVSSFGQDARGEIYILSLGGPVWRIVPD